MAEPATSVRPLDPDRRAELESERDDLLRALDDLERDHDAGDVDDADYATLRDDLTARAADVLRRLEGAERVVRAQWAERPSRRRSRWLVAAVLVVAAAVGGVFLAGALGERDPGEVATGSIRQTDASRLTRAETLFARGEVLEALQLADEVLDGDPDNLRALLLRGRMLVATGLGNGEPSLVDRGFAALDRAVEVDPFARLVRGDARATAGDRAGAVEDFEAIVALDRAPEAMKDAARQALRNVRGDPGETGASNDETETGDPDATGTGTGGTGTGAQPGGGE